MFDAIDRETEADLRAAVDRDRLAAHVDALADRRRYPGSADQRAAADYVLDRLAEYGVDARDEAFEAYVSVPEDASVTATAPVHRDFDAVTPAFSANTPDTGITAPVSVVPDVADSDLAGVAGRIVLARGLPTPDAVTRLEAADAAAAVFTSPTPGHRHEMIVSPVWGTPTTETAGELPGLPVASVSHEDGAWLRETAAGDDVTLTVRTRTRTELTELPCPVGEIQGTASDRFLLVGNHLDSWHEGVTDNATAVAATLELARVLADHPPKRGVRFGFWPGHSMGRYAGSARYADAHWLDLRENGVAYVHLDLNGLDGADSVWFQHTAEVAAEHRAVLETASLPLQDGGEGESFLGAAHRPGRNSDQSFWGTGLASLLSGARFTADHPDAGPIGGGWWWHTPADTRDKVDLDVLAEETELYAALAARFCCSPVLPHDHRAAAAELRDLTSTYDPESDAVDLAPIYDRLDTLDDRLDAFTDALDGVDVDAGGVDAAAEDAQVALGNALVPAAYTDCEDTDQLPALTTPRLPALAVAADLPDLVGPRRRFAEVELARGVNRTAHRLDAAIASLDAFLADRN